MIVSHIGPPMGPFGDPWGAPKWPKQHQNGLKWPKIYRGGQNGPTRPKMVLQGPNGPSGTKTVLRDILYDYMLYWPTQEGP